MSIRVLFVGDSPLLASGFGRVIRELMIRLAKEPGLELACLGWGFDGWPYDARMFPCCIYPGNPSTYGEDVFERVVNEFRPSVVITLGELWMLQWMRHHPTRAQFKWISYVPIDGGPLYPPWQPFLREMDEIVAMSRFGQEILQAGLPSKRIHMIHHGVDSRTFRPLEERAALKEHDRLRGKFLIGCVARNQPRKNLPALVKAFALLAPRYPAMHLYLHSNPCDVGFDLVTLLHRYQLQGRADVASPEYSLSSALNDQELNRLYNACDITALPTNAEGFGLPIVESLAAGVPVVATRYSACIELVEGRGELVDILTTQTLGNNLIEHAVVDVEDLARRIETLYLNPGLIACYAEAGRRFAVSLDWDLLIPKWMEIIRGTIGQ